MGSWDCYCAICGGPLYGAPGAVSGMPRTAAFLKKRAKEIDDQRREKEGTAGKDDDSEYDDDEDDETEDDEDDEDEDDGYGARDEENLYDQDVISVEDVQWTQTLHVLGFNPDSEEEDKTFVTGPGSYIDCGEVLVENGDDPNAQGFDLNSPSCYRNVEHDQEALYPFHWCCYEILSKCLTGSFGDGGLDKDLLHSIMNELSPDSGSCTSLEHIDYGDASRMQHQVWEAEAGYEFIVSHPRDTPGVNKAILSMFASDAFKPRPSCIDLANRVRDDPFLRMPYDIIYRISSFILDEDLVSLARSSWPIHALLQSNNQFWRLRLKTSFPWFFEFLDLLEQDETLLQTNDARRIFQWLKSATRPAKWLTGPMMGVANRRRIWSVCEQLGDIYWPEKHYKASMSEEERLIRRYSKCAPPSIVSFPPAMEENRARTVYWAKTWSEVRSQTKTLESFWDRRGSLVGISLTPDGQERRLLGLGDSDDGIVKESVKLGAEEWIKGLILHLPVPTWLSDSRLATSPNGLTIILDSGRTSGMGNISNCHTQRLLSAAPDWRITGINGITGLVLDNWQLIELGLAQAPYHDEPDYSVPPHDLSLPLPTPLGRLMWDDDYSQILGQRIQEHQTLEMREASKFHETDGLLSHDLITHGALIWAKDAVEHRALRRLTGCVVTGGKAASRWLYGVSAEYEPTTHIGRRSVGLYEPSVSPDVKSTELFESFDIDGPGGEVVTRLEIPVGSYPRALKVHTNRGRTCSWGETDAPRWNIIEGPLNETLVGIVVESSTWPYFCAELDGYVGQDVMSVVAGLWMRR